MSFLPLNPFRNHDELLNNHRFERESTFQGFFPVPTRDQVPVEIKGCGLVLYISRLQDTHVQRKYRTEFPHFSVILIHKSCQQDLYVSNMGAFGNNLQIRYDIF